MIGGLRSVSCVSVFQGSLPISYLESSSLTAHAGLLFPDRWSRGTKTLGTRVGSLLVIVIMIDGSQKHNCEGVF